MRNKCKFELVVYLPTYKQMFRLQFLDTAFDCYRIYCAFYVDYSFTNSAYCNTFRFALHTNGTLEIRSLFLELHFGGRYVSRHYTR